VASRSTFSRVENHRTSCFLQGTTPWHGRAAPRPRRSTICYSQSCNCLAAFAFRFNLKPFRARIFTVVKLLILEGWAWSGCCWCWLRRPCEFANWSQVVASRSTFSRVENHRISCFLQGTTPWHSRAAPRPRHSTICYSQSCNCLAAFAFRFDLKPFRARIFTVVELLVLGGWAWSGCCWCWLRCCR